jgi:hypothetical protein
LPETSTTLAPDSAPGIRAAIPISVMVGTVPRAGEMPTFVVTLQGLREVPGHLIAERVDQHIGDFAFLYRWFVEVGYVG